MKNELNKKTLLVPFASEHIDIRTKIITNNLDKTNYLLKHGVLDDI